MSILVLLQGHGDQLSKSAQVAIEAARQFKSTWNKDRIVGLVLGPAAEKLALDALEYELDECIYLEHELLTNYLAAPYADCLKAAFEASSADTVIATATSIGKDLMPRFAGLIDAGQASDVISINSDKSFTRPMYAGNILAEVELLSNLKCITVRQTAFQPAKKTSKKGTASKLNLTIESLGSEFVSYETSGGDRPDLGDAEVVVSGGRALGSADNFEKYIAPLADILNGAIGASRAAVDSGYAPNDWQVGQTGKVVAPSLYIAIGISGAIQHLAGMKDSKVIVSLNKDPDAPIFEVSDYGLVCDLFEAVPQLVDEIKKTKNQ